MLLQKSVSTLKCSTTRASGVCKCQIPTAVLEIAALLALRLLETKGKVQHKCYK